MNLNFTTCVLTILCASLCSYGQTPAASPSSKSEANPPRLLVDPSSTTVSLGKASLTVNPLVHEGRLYTGGYELHVVPYVFKNENGKLELDASDETVEKLLAGTALEFTGKATNDKNGKSKAIVGKITPSAKDHGKVTFSVQTDNGPMIFNTTYHFEPGH